jgi:4-amino-4-deoxy-L-arabinose transferase-like glycosyltransferase
MLLNWKREPLKEIALFLFFLFLVVFAHVPEWHQPYFWDALGAYLHATLVIYNDGLNPLQGGNDNIGHPPLILWFTALGWKMWGMQKLFMAHLVIYLTTALLLFAMYIWGRRLVNPLFGFAVALITFAMPIIYWQSAQLLLDLPMTAFFVAALYCVWQEKWTGYLLASSALTLTKAYGWFYLFPFVVFHLGQGLCPGKKIRIRTLVILLVPAGVFMAYEGLVYAATGTWFGGEMWKIAAPARIRSFWEACNVQIKVLKNIFNNSGLETPLPFCLAAGVIYFVRSMKGQGAFRQKMGTIIGHKNFGGIILLLLAVCVSFGAILPLRSPCIRYHLPLYPPLFLLGMYGFYHLVKGSKILFLGFCFLLMALFLIRWHWTYAESISRVFPVQVRKTAYRFLVYDDARERRPPSFSGEVSKNYVYWLRVMKRGCRWLEKEHPGAVIAGHFPVIEYFSDPLHQMATRSFPIKRIDTHSLDSLSPGYLFIKTSLCYREDIFQSVVKDYQVERIYRTEKRGQWMDIYRLGSKKPRVKNP